MPRSPSSLVVDVDGPVSLTEHGGDPDAPTVLCIHGLGSSSASWQQFARALARDHRVLTVDLPGHGGTPRHGRSVTMQANTRLLHEVLEQLGPAMLVGHSMGAALTALVAAARPGGVPGVVLMAPPMPRLPWEPMTPELATRVALCSWPWLARTALAARFRRLGPEEFVRRGLALTCSSVDSVDPGTQAMLVQRAEAGSVADHATFVDAARSVGMLVARSGAYRQTIASIDVPGLVIQGADDRLATAGGLAQLAKLQPGWRTTVLPDVGHSPHMESPAAVADQVRAFFRGLAPSTLEEVSA